jgi:rsbT co-antagonist protein RsbR
MDRSLPTAERTLMREMGLTDHDIERRQAIVGLGRDDFDRIAAVRDLVTHDVDRFVAAFFDHLARLEEARPLLGNRDLLERARVLKREHLVAMTSERLDADYVEQRVKLAMLYSRAGLDVRTFLGAFHAMLRTIGQTIMRRAEPSATEAFERFIALKKVAFFDLGVIMDVIIWARERTIVQQQEAIRELSTPVLQIRERMLLLPLIGVIDTHRARLVTESLLRAIRAHRARVVVMDVTGVATIDSKVANHLLQTVSAARLMGAIMVVTGLSADVAQSLVALGIELTKLRTVGDLQGGMELAERLLGYKVTHDPTDASLEVLG